jgi:hypothetical protein
VELENPDLNFTVRSAGGICRSAAFPLVCERDPAADAGCRVELGSGMFINSVLPEAAAESLRKVAVEKAIGVGE